MMIWYMYWKMFTTLRLVNRSFTTGFVVLVMVRALRLYSHSNFQVYNAVLLIMLLVCTQSNLFLFPLSLGSRQLQFHSLFEQWKEISTPGFDFTSDSHSLTSSTPQFPYLYNLNPGTIVNFISVYELGAVICLSFLNST